MLEIAQVLSIVNLSIVVLVRWFSGNSHSLSAHGWSSPYMSMLVYLLEKKMIELRNDLSLITKEEFMINMFSALQDEIEPYEEFIKC